ncbi:SMP-30/gluconolactonase/LRE family protein [Microbulbifer sp. 2205BS26-8]|uniref:SMP-30/gluconolactonase/LRE family protein n=1 Tax=Microbulbifer sp. 2205BS26-8 TaxID=3064386 RepID=UPI00273F1B8C|nr:SMP-30/gluconolactonase/LRE family protein [Microbulbifer sp. 2205BS26-8]MDP5210802.1 SMP-30/gluconolactonase/LRE family protein [Microbulbifer sp. 2205BS26-8]
MKTHQLELTHAVSVQNTLGEGVLWDVEQQAAWWTDIEGQSLYRFSLSDERLQSWACPQRVGCIGLTGGGRQLLAGFESGIAIFDPYSGAVEWLEKPEIGNPGNRFNDGRMDRQGRFWAGTMVEDEAKSTQLGALYCLDVEGQCDTRLRDIHISNGLCWSPDSKVMYHTDTPSQVIKAYDFDPETGNVGKGQAFATTEPGCFPDGACVDRDGYLYSAEWGGSRVVRYAPDGSVDGIIPVPVSQPTCVTFGGENLDMLFVTTASYGLSSEQLSEEAHAGDLLVFKTPFAGLAEPTFGNYSEAEISS